MVTAEVTPHIVTKTELVQDAITGTPPRITEFYLEAVKAQEDDWIILGDAIGAPTGTASNVVGYYGVVEDSSQDLVAETLTYDESTDKLVLDGTTTGTAKVWVRRKQE